MRVLISGYYGFGNTGDEALLSGVIKSLRTAGNVHLTVLSSDPTTTERQHGVAAIHRTRWSLVRHAVKKSDLFISGGGGLLQDRTSFRSPYYYMGLIQLARMMRKPVYLFAQGIGPIRRTVTRHVASRLLSGVAGIGVRDPASRDALIKWGVPEKTIEVTSDAAFALDPPGKSLIDEALNTLVCRRAEDKKEEVSTRLSPRIGVVWRSCVPLISKEQQRRLTDEVAGALVDVLATVGGTVVIVPFQPSMDRESGQELHEAIVRQAGKDVPVYQATGAAFDQNFSLVSGMDLLLTVRYHGLVLATISGVPAVSITYDPKVYHLSGAVGVEKMTPLEVEKKTVIEALLRTWHQRSDISHRLHAFASSCRDIVFREGERAIAAAREFGR